jgi:cytosine/adenosine deaminase-related metal-dependent hydrolase
MGRVVDIDIPGGKIAVVGEGAAPPLSNGAPVLDIGGDLVLPGLVGHMHLDKTPTGLPRMGHAAGPTRMSIAPEWARVRPAGLWACNRLASQSGRDVTSGAFVSKQLDYPD